MLRPFFIRVIDSYQGYFLWFPVLLGLSFLIPFLTWIGIDHVDYPVIILTSIIIVAFLALFIAILTFNNIIPKIDTVCCYNFKVTTLIKKNLSDKRFALFGFFFSGLNSLIGYVLGIPEVNEYSQWVYLWGYMLAGFICGLAICGVHGLIIILIKVLNQKFQLDYTHPDKRGGTGFLGNSIMIFSGVTISVGVLIASYILTEEWNANKMIVGEFNLNDIILWFWVFWPFFVGSMLLLVPSLKINALLIAYKTENNRALSHELLILREDILSSKEAENLEIKKSMYSFKEELRATLNSMNTWPFSLHSYFSFSSVFFANILVTYNYATKLIDGLFTNG